MSRPRVVVTGADGFVGRHLVERLARRCAVVSVSRPGNVLPSVPGVRRVHLDLATEWDRASLPRDVDAVVHLAQSRRYRDLPAGEKDVQAVNVDGTRRLVEYAQESGASRFVFASSGGVYGGGPGTLREDAPIRPADAYQASKAEAERVVMRGFAHGRAILLRPFFVYGPGQRNMLVPRLMEPLLHGAPVDVSGDPGIRISPIFVDDAVTAFEAALDRPVDGAINVAGSEVVSIRGLVEMLGTLSRRVPQIRAAPPSGAGDLVADIARMRDTLAVDPAVSLHEGLRRTVAARLVEVAP